MTKYPNIIAKAPHIITPYKNGKLSKIILTIRNTKSIKNIPNKPKKTTAI